MLLKIATVASALTLRMAVVPPGGDVVCVGAGAVFLLTAKTSAAAGYKTTIVSNDRAAFERLLWGEDEPNQNLQILSPDDFERFSQIADRAPGVLIAFDGDQTLSENLLDVVLPSPKRVALMSRNLNGKGMGPFVTASKVAANKEVWTVSDELVDMYRKFEASVAERAADLVVVRAGTLKGGGPGDLNSVNEKGDKAATSLTYGFYRQGQQDLVNWRLVFDCDTCGMSLMPGDTAPGPGWRAAFTATSPDAEPGDSGRIAIAQALVRSLSVPGLAGRDFGVVTRKARLPPTDADWAAEFAKVMT